MSDNKATMLRVYEEVFSRGDVDLIDELLADDFIEHEELPPGIPPGKGAPRALVSMMRSAFPDFHVMVEEMLEDGDKVITRARFSGPEEQLNATTQATTRLNRNPDRRKYLAP